MKNVRKIGLISIFSIIVFSSLLLPMAQGQEWVYDGANTPRIKHYSVYPSEWYGLNTSGWGTPLDELRIMHITHGNTSTIGDTTRVEVWGRNLYKNITTGAIRVQSSSFGWGSWNEEVGTTSFGFMLPFIDGAVPEMALYNVSDHMEEYLSSAHEVEYEHKGVYPSIQSIAYWNHSNGAYLNMNWTAGVLYKWTCSGNPWGNVTLYSRPAQLPPEFSFTAETGLLDLVSTNVKFNITILDADNNNDGETDTDYLYRIGNGIDWTDWAVPSIQVDYDLSGLAEGSLNITIEVKNMYGAAQESLIFTYTPPEDDVIPSYSTLLILVALIFSVSIITHKSIKKLRKILSQNYVCFFHFHAYN